MQFGFNVLLWTTFVEEEHDDLFDWLKEVGYDGVEIPSGDGPVDHYHKIRSMADASGLLCTSIAMATPEADPSSPDDAVRAAGLDRIKSRIECAQILGSPVLGGPLYTAHKFFKPGIRDEDDLKRAADVLAEAAEFADEANLTLCLEPLNRFEIELVNTTAAARQIVDMVGHPRLQIHYDTHHAHIEEKSHEDALAACEGCLGHFHASESHRGTLGEGMIDWASVSTALKKSGYDGWMVVEAFGTQVDGLRQAANVHRDCYDSRESLAERSLSFMKALVD